MSRSHSALKASALGLALLAAAPALGQADYVFTVNPALSQVEVKVTLIEFSLTDSDTSPVGGAVGATLTPAGGPFTQIHITDLALLLTEDINIFLDGSLLQGDIIATGQNMGLLMDEEGVGLPGAPAAVNGAGAFNQVGNWVQAAGTINYQGTGPLFGLLGSGTINLLEYPPNVVDQAGTVLDDGDTVTLTLPIDTAQVYPVVIANVEVHTTGVIVATAPSQGGSVPGDLTGDGCVGQSDLGILLADFGCTDGVGNCPGDVDGDGDTDQSDLGILLGHFGTGC
ncbi:MAG: hypothetical protein LC135_13970 [Phycisphaerae bacterium]|nr:hypothetical protein [Phycisphaerae bacterium]MCZ2400958.1 hypothetical protein [Phycisphaerae bacterium]NUQ49093.1 hypothetical protein [Phycisphaerae bacterium]